jgi:uncharacterized membrane protein YoaK (UPF0700 family)
MRHLVSIWTADNDGLAINRGKVCALGRRSRAAGARVGRRLLAVLTMVVGALAGALLVLHANASLSLALAFVVLVVVTTTAALVSRQETIWSRSS